MNDSIATRSRLSRRRVMQITAAVGASMLAGGLLAACGEDNDDDDANAASAAGAGQQADAPTATAAESDDEDTTEPQTDAAEESAPSDSGEGFVVANTSEPADLLPWFGGYETGLITRQIYQTLVEPRMTIGESGVASVEMTPQLAEAWELVEPTRWRFNLRQGVTFHNGEEFNADAAIFSLETLTNQEILDQFGKSNYLRGVTAWEKVDDFTFDVTTETPDTEFPGMLMRIGFVALPPAFIEENGMEALGKTPIGTGPYMFESWERGQQILLTRFEDYWKPDGPAMPSVRYIVREEASVRAQTIKAGESHFAYNIGIEQAKALDNYIVGGGFQSSSLRVNNQIEPTSDIRLRQALNYAIDRESIAEAIFGGVATPIAFFGFQPVDLDPFPYDVEMATQLIQEAGLDGTELELVYGEGRIPEEDQLGEIYKASFEAAGLKINLNKVEPGQYNEIGGLPFEEQPALYMETTSSGNFGEVAGGLFDKYGCEGTGTFCDPEFDALYGELRGLVGQERTDLLQSIAERLHNEETPRVWVVAVQQVHGLGPNVETDFPANTYIHFDDITVV